jgi:cold shock CspA family protein
LRFHWQLLATSLQFERSAITWGEENPPKAGQRLSYDVETKDRQARAVNLQTI